MTGAAAARGDVAVLADLLGAPGAAWIVSKVRTRIAAGLPVEGPVVIRLGRPTSDQREAAARLVGLPRRAGAALTVDLGSLDTVLRRGLWPAGLVDAVQVLTGPVEVRRAVREREAAAWARAESAFGAALDRFPSLAGWWRAWCGAGNLKRAATAEHARRGGGPVPEVAAELVQQAVRVLAELPAPTEPLAVLARRTTGDAHALDAGRPLGRFVVAAVAAAFGGGTGGGGGGGAAAVTDGMCEVEGSGGFAPVGAGAGAVEGPERPVAGVVAGPAAGPSARGTWALAGVVLSTVASTVLCLGVPGADRPGDGVDGPGDAAGRPGDGADRPGEGTDRPGDAAGRATATALAAFRAARMPVTLTLDQVRSGGVGVLATDATVHVCENPTVVEVVAARWASAPERGGLVLVCTWGQPSSAVVHLLRVLTAHGAAVRYHGDFDWAGLRIAKALAERVPWSPWRFTADDYVDALRSAPDSRRLTGLPADAPWDPGLAVAMSREGAAVEEEAVAALLASDLVP